MGRAGPSGLVSKVQRDIVSAKQGTATGENKDKLIQQSAINLGD